MNINQFVPPAIPQFYRTYRAELPAIGALIIFATFIANDHYRDDAKNLADALSHAQEIFNIRQEMLAPDETLGTISHGVQHLTENLIPSGAIKKSSDDMQFLQFFRIPFDAAETAQQSDKRLMEDIDELNKKLPTTARDSGQIDKIKTALMNRAGLIEKEHAELYTNTNVDKNAIFNLYTALEEQRIEIDMRIPFVQKPVPMDPHWAVTNEADTVFTNATGQRIIADANARWWRRVSLALYLAGFLLSFGGKVFHIDGIESSPG